MDQVKKIVDDSAIAKKIQIHLKIGNNSRKSKFMYFMRSQTGEGHPDNFFVLTQHKMIDSNFELELFKRLLENFGENLAAEKTFTR